MGTMFLCKLWNKSSLNFANKSSWQKAPNMTVCDQQVLAPEEWPLKQRKNYINKQHSSIFPWRNLVSFFSDVMELSGSAFYLSAQTEINFNLSRPHVCLTQVARVKRSQRTQVPMNHNSCIMDQAQVTHWKSLKFCCWNSTCSWNCRLDIHNLELNVKI